jgi:hypothetical protein
MKLKRRQVKNFLKPLLVGVLFFMSSFVFGQETIELEYGEDALEAYKSYQLESADTYISDDPSIARVDEDGLITAMDYGDTYVHTLVEGQIKNTYQVIVYFVEEEKTPFAPPVRIKPFIQGYPDGSFKADQEITYGEYGAMLSKLLNLDLTQANTDHWAEPYIRALHKESYLINISVSDLDRVVRKEDLKDFLGSIASKKAYIVKAEILNDLEKESTLTRGHMVYYLYETFSKDKVGFAPPRFKDVPMTHPYAVYINSSVE